MANVRDVVRLINAVAPEANAITDGYDNVGLIVGKADNEVYRVLCCLDVTEEVLREAIDSDAPPDDLLSDKQSNRRVLTRQ